MVSLIDFVFGRMISLVIFGLVLTSLLVVLRLKARASCNEDRRDETVSGPISFAGGGYGKHGN